MIVGAFWLGMADKLKYNRLKKSGIKVPGTIIANKEKRSVDNDMYRMGGNINNPTVRFSTPAGTEVIGTPVIGFVTQNEVHPPINVMVYYDANRPETFCIDFD